jgi:hypothetical protein
MHWLKQSIPERKQHGICDRCALLCSICCCEILVINNLFLKGNTMKVSVYFEAKTGSHMVAQFDEEETYMVCLESLESLAKSKGYIVTESLTFEGEE